MVTRQSRVLARLPRDWDESLAVVWAGIGLIAVQVGLRAWALYGSWFYTDDYRLLYDASRAPLGWAYLSRPFDSQFMPVGRLLAWGVERSGVLQWSVAATGTVLLQAVASAACLWMLVVLFGRRWAVLVPLSLYLFTAITVPALMWWAASLNQLPVQAATFAATATWVQYLRSSGVRHLLATAVLVGLALLTYVKAILVLPLLAYLAVAYFTEGSLAGRLRQGVRRWWPALLGLVLVASGYVAYYVASVPQPLGATSGRTTVGLADTMLGTAFATAVVGGPWRWTTENPPTSLADPPTWTVTLSWCLSLLVVLYGVLRRRRTGRAWFLLAGYLVALVLLVATGRANIVGSVAGLEYRYLTDAAGVVALCVGLAFLELRGAPGSSERREEPLLRVTVGAAGVATLTAAVCVGGLLSSYGHVAIWHRDNPGAEFMQRAQQDLARQEQRVYLADRPVPEDVMPGFAAPYNFASRLFTLLEPQPDFPRVAPRLAAVDDDGGLHRAVIDVGVSALPGTTAGCGWKVDAGGATIPLEGRVLELDWWMRIGYLAGRDTPAVIRAGDTVVRTDLRRGLNDVYVKNDGGFDEVHIQGLAPGAVVCVDSVEVGRAEPDGTL